MFIVFLRFSNARARAAEFAPAHKAWLQRGLEDGCFVLAGSLLPQAGGVILAHGLTREALDTRLAQDPFVAEDVVQPEVHEVRPAMAQDALRFLVA